MFDTGNFFKGAFGKIEPGMCKFTMNGDIAVKCHDGSFKSYNVKKKRLVDISNFGFNADDMFFVIPTTKVKVGDIILSDGKPKCVIADLGESIKVIDYDNAEIREILPVRHIFMGATYFYGKIVSLFGDSFKSGKGMNKLMSTYAMMSMFGGNNMKSNNGGFDPSMFLLMSMMNSNNGSNPFEEMFSGMELQFNFNADDEDDELLDIEGKEEN